ncbi:MAG: class I SAM-dependent methyltransferase [Dehalococcoidia bacterium]
MARPQAPLEYQQIERDRIRRAHARHPYAHHIRRLPAELHALIPDLAVPPGGAVLDYGCADMPYRPFFRPDIAYVGADLPGNQAAQIEIKADGTLPVEDQSFEGVLSTQVLEHVRDPGRYLSECFRVVRPGGRLLLSTHGIFAYHPDPADLWRWTCEGLRIEVEAAGFEVRRFEGIIGLASTGLQLLQDSVSYRLRPRWVPWLALVMQPIVAFADRFETTESLRYNAQVFALIAERAS